MKAHTWKPPAEIPATPLLRPDTSVGAVHQSSPQVWSSPSSPTALYPQHLAAPELVSAHEWLLPAVIVATPLERPETSTGVWRSVVVPSPSWHTSFRPQHLTPPANVRAQV